MIDLLFISWNRLEFTKASFRALLANTNWEHVRQLYIHDDDSQDGTTEWLRQHADLAPVPTSFHVHHFGGPVAVMRWYLDHPGRAQNLGKIDNDVAVPPGWLDHMLGVLERNQRVQVLGMEAGMTRVVGRDGDDDWDGVYRAEPCTHIGGVGLIRSHVFDGRPLHADGLHGWTEFQHSFRPARAWITPDLPVVLLDRLPFEPWRSLGREYVRLGWQRPWGLYDPVWMRWAWQWMQLEEAAA